MQLENLSIQLELTVVVGGEVTVVGGEVTDVGGEVTVVGGEVTEEPEHDMDSSPMAAMANLFSTRVLALSAVEVPVA